MGKICLGGAVKNVPLDLLPDAECGDRLLVCDGVAIARVAAANTLEDKYVSSDTW
jgi:hydrogenase maturation factor